MIRILLEDWSIGLDKVELNHLIRRHTGMGLANAKRLVDALLEHERASFLVVDMKAATEFCAEATRLGVLCSMTEEEVSSMLTRPPA